MKLRRYIMGWVNYFKITDMKKLLQTTDEWRRRNVAGFSALKEDLDFPAHSVYSDDLRSR